ncbi:MAG: lytic polysaccharide monooxygenase [Turicibacter sp.]
MNLKKLCMTTTTAFALTFMMNGMGAFAHGYINESRAHLAKQGINVNAGNVQYEPQSIEGKGNFPIAGPVDGQLAGAGIFNEMDVQTDSRWVKIPMDTGMNSFTWTLTARHRTSEFKYYITKDGWNPNEPITRADLEEIAVFEYHDTIPEAEEHHTFEIPANKSGYHVILGVWEVADTGNAFYQVIDVEINGAGEDTNAPSIPTNLSATPTTNSILLNWTASTDNTGVHHYDIYRDDVKVGTSTITQFTDTELMADTTYTYRIKAIDHVGNESNFSELISERTHSLPAVDTEAPTAPSGLHSMGETEDMIHLMWGKSTDNVAVSYYEIYRDDVLVGKTTQGSYKDSNLVANTAYTYTVIAVDTSNNVSAKSNVLVVSTKEKEGVEEGNTTWNKETIYLQGDVVKVNGIEYKAKWWTQGDAPEISDVWEVLSQVNPINWNEVKAYTGGEQVIYKGQTYQAKWWTQGEIPSESAVWELVK